MGAGEEQRFAQEMDEEDPGLDFGAVLAAVNANGDRVLHLERSFINFTWVSVPNEIQPEGSIQQRS